MKVLTYVPKIYEPQNKAYQNDKSGLAIYVHDIVMSLAPKAEVLVLTQQVSSGGQVSGVTYLSNTKQQILLQAKPDAYLRAFRQFFACKGGLNTKLKRAYLALEASRFERVLREAKPDVVNIHGCNPEIFAQIKACQKNNVPFVVSLHGLIGLDKSVHTTDALKNIERFVLQQGDEAQWPIVAISSGVKNRAVAFYRLKHPENIRVILNGTKIDHQDLQPSSEFDAWFQKVNPKGKKVVLCVGALSKRKNQTMVVEAWNRVPQEFKEKHMVLFLGKDLLGGAVQEAIEKYRLQDSMCVCGHQEKDALCRLYHLAVCNVLASIDEGFGLSMIEAMSFGVPSVTFADLDAVPDLYHKNVIKIAKSRDVSDFADGIMQALTTEWDADFIRGQAAFYSMSHVSEKYFCLYDELR